MSNNTNYNALTDSDLRLQLEWNGYLLHYNDADRLELFSFTGSRQVLGRYLEKSTGETFDSVQAAHRYVFSI
jgi:hypothetical protein